MIADVLISLILVIVLILAVIAIIRGYRGIKMSSTINDKKPRYGFLIASTVHLLAGIIITLGSAVMILISLSIFFGG